MFLLFFPYKSYSTSHISTLSLHDALPISRPTGYEMHYACPQNTLFSVPIVAEKVRMLYGERGIQSHFNRTLQRIDRKSTRLNSSHVAMSYAVFCLKKKC